MTVFVHQDRLGSTTLLTSSTGAVIATHTYGAYGAITAHTGYVGPGASPVDR